VRWIWEKDGEEDKAEDNHEKAKDFNRTLISPTVFLENRQRHASFAAEAMLFL
jgi:hypothetical protein